MKKILILAVCILGFTAASAQVSFKPGIRGGINFSHFTKGENNDYYYGNNQNSNFDRSSKTDFYLGFFGALKLSKFYTLQPEVDYSRQGSNIKYTQYNYNTDTYNTVSSDLEVSYISIAVANKFTFNKFNFHVGPTIDFVVEENFNTESEVDLAFFLGAGYNFTDNFGIEARVKKGIIPVLDYSDGNHTNVVFSVGATYTFDVK